MWQRSRQFRLYGVIAILAIALGFVLLYYWLFVWPDPRFPAPAPEDIQSDAEDNSRAQSLDEEFGKTKITLRDANLSVASEDGQMRMQLWLEEGSKRPGGYSLDQGVLEFNMNSGERLILRVTDARYAPSGKTITVEGKLIGWLELSDRYFEAERITWDQRSRSITAFAVRYVDEGVSVSGGEMKLDMTSGRIDFTGPVEAQL
jgi:hypothetical protein